MIRAKDIQEQLLHLIGWEQNYDTSDFSIAEHLTESETGLYFQQVHPLITLQNMQSIAPDFKNITFPAYSDSVDYMKGAIVSFEGKLYKALIPSAGVPVSNIKHWTETDLFSEWLEKKTKASIQKAITRFITDKLIKGSTKMLFENKTLFDGTGRLTDLVKNKQNLVGLEIVPIRSAGVTTKINKIGLQFTEPGEYNIYIMHSSSDAPVYKLKFNKTRKNTMEWFSVENVYLPYVDTNQDAGGSWYICYLQSELPENSKAIRKDRDWSKGPCGSCSRQEYTNWSIWSKYLEIHPFWVNEEFIERSVSPSAIYDEVNSALIVDISSYDEDEQAITLDNCIYDEDNYAFIFEDTQIGIKMWDVENNQYTYDTNYGINLELSIGCDLTDFIISQRHIFQDIISKQLAVDMLREFAFNANVRTNRHSINASRIDILYELDGDSSSLKQSGLNFQLENAFKAIELSTEGLDRICQPCVNHGIKYRTV